MPKESPTANSKLGGLITRQYRWSLSAKGWALLLLALITIATFLFFGIYSFLAPTIRIETSMLVVEGWIDSNSVSKAALEFAKVDYQTVFCIGTFPKGYSSTNKFSTHAAVGAKRLKLAGIPAERVYIVPAMSRDKHRTFGSALALRDYCNTNGIAVTNFNVVTQGPHSRRTRLLFEKAFGPNVQVGVISIPDEDYNPADWWNYSEGVKEVISEAAAYLYVRFFFHPKPL